MNLARTYTTSSVVLVGSGKSAMEFANADFSKHILVVMNNAWKLFPDTYDIAIWAADIHPSNRPIQHAHQIHVSHNIGPRKDERPIPKDQEMGYGRCIREIEATEGIKVPLTSLTASGFWCLWYLKPKKLGFIGCDLDYTPDASGHTHFYGVGYDIQKRNTPDPFLRFSKEQIIASLHDMQNYATKIGCELVNYSANPRTLLPFRKEEWKDYKK